MPIVIQCSCGQSLQIRDELIGQRVACPDCGAVLTASAPAGGITATPPAPPPAAVPPPLPPSGPAPLQDLGEVVAVWGMNELISGPNLTVLTSHAFCIATLPRGELKEAKRRLEAGAAVQKVLGSSVRALPLAIIQAVRLSNKEATLTLGYLDGARRAHLTLQYIQPVQRWVFNDLRPLLGRGWKEESVEATAWSAAGLPLTVIGLLLFFDLIGFLAARQEEGGFQHTSSRGKMGGAIAGLIGSAGCLVIGALLLIAGVAWLIYAILKRPPAVVTITRTT